MPIITLLHNLLKESLPSIHAARLQALMAAVEAGLHGASVSITALGRSLSGPAYIKHKIKRMDRLAGNHHLNTERMALYAAMTQWLLKSLPMPLILIFRQRISMILSSGEYGAMGTIVKPCFFQRSRFS